MYEQQKLNNNAEYSLSANKKLSHVMYSSQDEQNYDQFNKQFDQEEQRLMKNKKKVDKNKDKYEMVGKRSYQIAIESFMGLQQPITQDNSVQSLIKDNQQIQKTKYNIKDQDDIQLNNQYEQNVTSYEQLSNNNLEEYYMITQKAQQILQLKKRESEYESLIKQKGRSSINYQYYLLKKKKIENLQKRRKSEQIRRYTDEEVERRNQIARKLQKQLNQEEQKISVEQEKINKQNQMVQSIIQNQMQKINQEYFEYAVNRLQISNGFYRFGIMTSILNLDKRLHFNPDYSKWSQKKQKSISFIDLKCFIISCLYPRSSLIFSGISTQSKLYHTMFNYHSDKSKGKDEEYLKLIEQMTIRHYQNRKYQLGSFLRKNVNVKKRKLVFISSENQLQQKINYIKDQISKFNNKLIQVYEIRIQQPDTPSQLHGFSYQKFHINYRFSQIKLQMQFQIYFDTPYNITKKKLMILSDKTNQIDLAFIWMQIPRYIRNEYFDQLNNVYDMLKRMYHLSSGYKG